MNYSALILSVPDGLHAHSQQGDYTSTMQRRNAVTTVPAQSPMKLALLVLTLATTALGTQANAANTVGGFGLEGSHQVIEVCANTVGGFGLE